MSAANLTVIAHTHGHLSNPSSEGAMSINPFEFINNGYQLVGSVVGTVEDMKELVQLAAEGKVKTHLGRSAKLSEINQVFEELQQGKFVGRAIIDKLME